MRSGLALSPQEEARIEAVATMLHQEMTEPFPEQFMELSPILQETFGDMRPPTM